MCLQVTSHSSSQWRCRSRSSAGFFCHKARALIEEKEELGFPFIFLSLYKMSKSLVFKRSKNNCNKSIVLKYSRNPRSPHGQWYSRRIRTADVCTYFFTVCSNFVVKFHLVGEIVAAFLHKLILQEDLEKMLTNPLVLKNKNPNCFIIAKICGTI